MTDTSQPPEQEPIVDSSAFVEIFGTKGRVRILDVLLRRFASGQTRSEISQAADINPTTFDRNIDKLRKYNIITEKKIGEHTLYQINTDNPIVQILGKAHTELMRHNHDIIDESEPPYDDMSPPDHSVVKPDRGNHVDRKDKQRVKEYEAPV